MTTKEAEAPKLEWDDLASQALRSRKIDDGIAMTFDAALGGGVESPVE